MEVLDVKQFKKHEKCIDVWSWNKCNAREIQFYSNVSIMFDKKWIIENEQKDYHELVCRGFSGNMYKQFYILSSLSYRIVYLIYIVKCVKKSL